MRNIQLWDDTTKETLCSDFATLFHQESIFIQTQKGGLFRMTNRYLVDTPGGNGSLVGLRFEQFDTKEDTLNQPTCSPEFKKYYE